jgi:hypothetical protein
MGGTEALTKLITNQQGVTSNQAVGGVGSILSLAKERLSGMDLTALTAIIPRLRHLYEDRQEPWRCDGPVGDRSGLTSAFSRLGHEF